jgi:hypothetical protein
MAAGFYEHDRGEYYPEKRKVEMDKDLSEI